MKKTVIAIALFVFSLFQVLQAQQAATQLSDWEGVFGMHTGSLSYKDYGTGEMVTIHYVGLAYEKDGALVLEHDIYEWGKIYRQKYTYKFKDGSISQGGGWQLIEKDISEDGKSARAVFTQKGKDGNQNRKCTFRKTFTREGDKFTILKEVKFDDEDAFFVRNKYVMTAFKGK